MQGTELRYRTRVPWFNDGSIVSISNFHCQGCSFSNKDVSCVGADQGRGVKVTLQVPSGREGLVHQKRELIKSEFCSLSIPEVGFEIPARTDKGQMNSVEGILRLAQRNLQTMVRSETMGEGIALFLEKLEDIIRGEKAWTLEMDDVSGNSMIEPSGPLDRDSCLTVVAYERTPEDHEAVMEARAGVPADPVTAEEREARILAALDEAEGNEFDE